MLEHDDGYGLLRRQPIGVTEQVVVEDDVAVDQHPARPEAA